MTLPVIPQSVLEAMPASARSAILATDPHRCLDILVAAQAHIDQAVIDWANAIMLEKATDSHVLQVEKYLNRIRWKAVKTEKGRLPLP